ncbi:hypothetical protein PICSAR15_03754 [Mycobacterium avium subsp. paratuberculosis]|nr:hypothetical protein PICSAR110_03421 [Mycobacterium avium subsp. paratuberculosis]CAG6921425.1 hypothetical protein PICSAR124B_03784 [Mycobacterium avium subsp. paratuberculosis]CAG7015684.1 hypothetical protein PICSAR15_03754 [Mycobacterium avium subsp. paratuberculosis]CAG7110666.1 hypothetical protein PICSAR2_03628 [Mycobacterium avium subsp. paratuberculosis]CAG7194858.1 hypothetical protein PICSAR252_03115 [Mycobacterium avium subsp. paratuberculosis]
MPQPPRIREPLDHQHRPALGPAHAVGGARVRLAAAVGRQAPVPAELDEDRRGGVHRRAAGQSQIALARSQRLHRHVQRHQRRRAGGVHRHRRALQPQHIRHPTRRHAGRHAGQAVALDLLGQHAVALDDQAGEHAGGAAAQLDGVNSGPLQCFPGQLEEHALLGIHGQGFAGGDAEERRVEVGDVVDETAGVDVALVAGVGVGVIQRRQVPAAVGGKLRDHVAALGHHLPQRLGAVHAAREAARHPDDRDRLARPLQERAVGALQAFDLDQRFAQRLGRMLELVHHHKTSPNPHLMSGRLVPPDAVLAESRNLLHGATPCSVRPASCRSGTQECCW